jgi:hypothetical protein
MPATQQDVDNLIQNSHIGKVADSAAAGGSGHRGFVLAAKPGAHANLESLLKPFKDDPSYAVWGPVTDAQKGAVFFLKCPTARCPVINNAAKDVRPHF